MKDLELGEIILDYLGGLKGFLNQKTSPGWSQKINIMKTWLERYNFAGFQDGRRP